MFVICLSLVLGWARQPEHKPAVYFPLCYAGVCLIIVFNFQPKAQAQQHVTLTPTRKTGDSDFRIQIQHLRFCVLRVFLFLFVILIEKCFSSLGMFLPVPDSREHATNQPTHTSRLGFRCKVQLGHAHGASPLPFGAI